MIKYRGCQYREAGELRIASKEIFYHGTATGQNDEILKSILAQGLNPTPKRRVFSDDDDRKDITTLGGTYLSLRAGDLSKFSLMAQKKFGGDYLYVIVQFETRTPTTTLDEDELLPIGRNQVYLDQYGRDNLNITRVDGSFLFGLLETDKIDWYDVAEHFLVSTVEPLWGKQDPRAVRQMLLPIANVLKWQAYYREAQAREHDGYWYVRQYDELIGVSPQEALQELRAATKTAMSALRSLATPPSATPDEPYSRQQRQRDNQKIQTEEPIGYRGANKIIAIMRWGDSYSGSVAKDSSYYIVGQIVYATPEGQREAEKIINSVLREGKSEHMLWTDPRGTVVYDEPRLSSEKAASVFMYKGREYVELKQGDVGEAAKLKAVAPLADPTWTPNEHVEDAKKIEVINSGIPEEMYLLFTSFENSLGDRKNGRVILTWFPDDRDLFEGGAYWFEEGGKKKLQSVYVSPEFRGRGGQLLADALKSIGVTSYVEPLSHAGKRYVKRHKFTKTSSALYCKSQYVTRDVYAKTILINEEFVAGLRKEFLRYMKNVRQVHDYDTAWQFKKVGNLYAEKFHEMFFERFTNYYLKHYVGLSKNMASFWGDVLRKSGWDFYLEISPPLSMVDEYHDKESLYYDYQQEVGKWANRVKTKARKLWKDLRDFIESHPSHREKEVEPYVELMDDDNYSIAGFDVRIRGYGQEGALPEYHAEWLSIAKEGLKEYRRRASERMPWMIKHALPFVLRFDISLNKAGEYQFRYIDLYMSALTEKTDPVGRFVKTCAHEMGHHLWYHLSGDAKSFWAKAVREDYAAQLDLQYVLDNWSGSDPDDVLAFIADDFLNKGDVDTYLQLWSLYYQPGYKYWFEKATRADVEKRIAEGDRYLAVQQHPISAYAGQNEIEAFCDAVGSYVAHGEKGIYPAVRKWLSIVLPDMNIRLAAKKASSMLTYKGRQYISLTDYQNGRNKTATRDRDTGSREGSGGSDTGSDAVGTQDSADPRAAREPDRHRGGTVGAATAAETRTADPRIKTAEEPEEPTETEMVEELEEEPGANWRDLYLQPIIRAIRNQFDLPEGQVTLLGPAKKVPFGSDTLGFNITGHVRFQDFSPNVNEYGRSPYRFTAHVDPNGELQLPVEVLGK